MSKIKRKKIFCILSKFFKLFMIVMLIAFILLPFYNMMLLSLVPEKDYISETILLFPKNITLDSFKYVLNNKSIVNGFIITTLVTVIGSIFNMFLTITSAYVLTKKFKGKKIYVFLIFIALYFDGGVLANYLLVKKIGLIDSIFAMILPTGINIVFLLMMTKSFSKVPKSLIDSAKLDGANDIDILRKIVIPISKPTIIAIFIYYAVERWNEWYLGMLYINTSKLQPLQLVLRDIISNVNITSSNSLAGILGIEAFDIGIKMACTIITMIPIIILFPFLQRYFINGLTEGSVKE